MGNKIGFNRQPISAAEWFDLDREEKSIMKWYPVDPENYSEDMDDVEAVSCPVCGSGELEYDGESYDDDEHRGAHFKCEECGHSFDMSDIYEDD